MKKTKVPVLLIAYRRPHETEEVLKKIKRYFPNDLYVFVDASNSHDDNVDKVKKLISSEVWALNVHTNFQEINLGCGLGPVEAINWVLSMNEFSIILEDDCVPSDSFFKYMEWALHLKLDDEKCFMVSGNKYSNLFKTKSVLKTKFCFIGGWGTWKRAWIGYDFNISSWSSLTKEDMKFIPYFAYRQRWIKIFNKVYGDNEKTYWDYQWQYHIWFSGGYSLEPPLNQIRNIGFNANATHTINKNDWRSGIKSHNLPPDFNYHIGDFNIINELQNSLIELGFVSYIYKIYYKIKVKLTFK
jgi:hypothetical protein